jgi:hypothetical protein
MRVAYLMRWSAALMALVFVTAIAADSRAQVEPRPRKPGRKYKVKIDSAPQQAAIYLDDEKYGIVGYTPWAGTLAKGNWKLILKKDGYDMATRIIQVKRSSRVQETFLPMTRRVAPGVLDVRSDADRNAAGADVWVDGQKQGQVPAQIKVADGRHLVEIKKNDFDSFSQWVEVKEGERVTINPMLRGAARGAILVEADVPDAEIYIDGNKHPDGAPSLINNVMEGPHIVEVRKEPAVPWRQTVQVEKNRTIKVSATLKSTIGGPGGNIRVMSNVDGAEVLLDGTPVGKAPVDIKDVKPGDHMVEARAKGYLPRDERVTINAGSSSVIKLNLTRSAGGTPVKIVSAVPEAEVFVDGERLGTAPQEKSLAAGEHYIVVSKQGYGKFERKVKVKAGQSQTITAVLKEAGGLRLLSSPAGATVMLDGEAIGATPMVREDIPAGEHIITMDRDGFYQFETGVKVEGGKVSVVNGALQLIDTGPTPEELEQEQRSLTTFGAKALPAGRSTMAAGLGYPYFLSARFMVGVGKVAEQIQFDAGIHFRTYGQRWDLSLIGRSTLFDAGPFAFGAFVDAGGGTTYFDDSQRDYWFFNGGLMASLTGLGAASVTGRAYMNAYTDRHCPGVKEDGTFGQADAPELCDEYLAGTIDPVVKARVDQLLDGDGEIFNRDGGVRLITSMAIEIAIHQHWSIWLLVEGVPRQEERAAFTDVLHRSMFEKDPRSYITGGATYKF